jgi:Fur family ferric uptake transcriptional regulator
MICKLEVILRFTENRELVYKVLKDAKTPLKAEEIKKRIIKELDLSTIYRALSFLENNQLINSASFGKNIRFFFCSENFKHFLFCERCEKIEVFDDCFACELEKKINEKYQFEIESHILYFRGICCDCKKENKK